MAVGNEPLTISCQGDVKSDNTWEPCTKISMYEIWSTRNGHELHRRGFCAHHFQVQLTRLAMACVHRMERCTIISWRKL